MGNTIGRRKKAKVMKIDGETFRLKTPIRVIDVVKDHPSHVLLDSEAVKHFGIGAKPLEPQQELKPSKIYFLVQLPKFAADETRETRRVRSGVHMSAKDRLECLMLSRRSISDLTIVRPSSGMSSDGPRLSTTRTSSSSMQVKVRLPKSQVEKLVEESENDVEVAEKIINLYMNDGGGNGVGEQLKLRPGGDGENSKVGEKRVSFVPRVGS